MIAVIGSSRRRSLPPLTASLTVVPTGQNLDGAPADLTVSCLDESVPYWPGGSGAVPLWIFGGSFSLTDGAIGAAYRVVIRSAIQNNSLALFGGPNPTDIIFDSSLSSSPSPSTYEVGAYSFSVMAPPPVGGFQPLYYFSILPGSSFTFSLTALDGNGVIKASAQQTLTMPYLCSGSGSGRIGLP